MSKNIKEKTEQYVVQENKDKSLVKSKATLYTVEKKAKVFTLMVDKEVLKSQ